MEQLLKMMRENKVRHDTFETLTDVQKAGVAGILQERSLKMREKNMFSPGQLIQWKAGLDHKRTKGPFIVMDVLADPIRDPERDNAAPYFNETLDIVLGVIYETGDFLEFHYDSRRFEPYTGPMPDDV